MGLLEVIDAAMVSAKNQVKLPDAVHIATAIRTRCTTFVTNDRQLRKVSDIPIVLLSDSIA